MTLTEAMTLLYGHVVDGGRPALPGGTYRVSDGVSVEALRVVLDELERRLTGDLAP